MKRDTQFEKELCRMFNSVQQVQAIQMEQLRENIEILHAANKSELDVNAVAQQILDTPVKDIHSREISFKCEGCTDCKGDHKFISKDPYVTIGSIGDLGDLSYVNVGSDKLYGKEFYHHCPEANYKLVRLIQYDVPTMHQCPICSQKYEKK